MSAIGSGTDLLARLLAASELRAKVISSNIANANTPGYKRQIVEFEDLLREALLDGSDRADRVEPEVLFDELTPGRPDGNNVSLELELNSMRENQLLYETYAAILQGRFQMLRTAITEGR